MKLEASDEEDDDQEDEEAEFEEENADEDDMGEDVDAKSDDGDASDDAGEAGEEDNGEAFEQEGEGEGDEIDTDSVDHSSKRQRLAADGSLSMRSADTSPEDALWDEDEPEDVIVGKRRRVLAATYNPVIRRRKLLRAYYSKVSSHASPTAVMLIPLVKSLNRPCTSDILWQAILGVTDHYLRWNISDDLYESICSAIKNELADDTHRFKVGEGDEEILVPGAEAGVVSAGLEYHFYLYRHWSLYESMCYSNYMCGKMSVWNSKGSARLQELLARLGIPLHQCKQNYKFMSPVLRAHFRKEILGPVAAEYGLSNPAPVYKSFYRYNAFKNPVSAADIVYAVSALMESAGFPLDSHWTDSRKRSSPDETARVEQTEDLVGARTWMAAFNEGFDCLSCKPEADEILNRGIQEAISIQKVLRFVFVQFLSRIISCNFLVDRWASNGDVGYRGCYNETQSII